MKTNLSYDEQINQLIETAENNMKNNRYFFISVSDSEKFFHAVCGIGIADGVWEWNDEEYNKCVLTLDSKKTKLDLMKNPVYTSILKQNAVIFRLTKWVRTIIFLLLSLMMIHF